MRQRRTGGQIVLHLAALLAATLVNAPPAWAVGSGPVACTGVRPPTTPVSSNHVASLAKLDKIAPPNVGVVALKSGAWSDPVTWGGRTPVGQVVIPNGVSVVFDLPGSRMLKTVRIEGCLEFSNSVSTRLNAEFVYVAPKGELLAGTPTAPIPPTVISQIVFPDFGPLDVSTDPTLVGKGLVSASRVELYGSLKTPRVKLLGSADRGDTIVQLAQTPSGWRLGDRVIITGTRFIPQEAKNGVVLSSRTQDEVRFIRAISGATVTLNRALSFSHASPDPAVGAYLVNYSRNIRLATQKGASLAKTQRGHSMFMSTQTVLQGVEFFEMGRTDKSKRAFDAAAIASPTPTSNLKGRYSLHLHQSGFPNDKSAPVVRNVSVWGSPGWGIAQHAGKAFLFQNNTWNTFGAGFVAESGNETGAWVENTAIKAIGVDHIVKDAGDVQAFDLGRTGDGFWLQSRSVRLHKNLAVGMTGGMGYVFFHRNNDLGRRFPLTAAFVDKRLCLPGSMRFRSQAIDKPQIAQFTENEAIASEVGFHITKPSPAEPHDIRSVIDGFAAWEVKTGVDITYTSRYTVKDSLLIGARFESGTTGVKFGQNTYDLVLASSRLSRFDYGVNLSKSATKIFAPTSQYTVADVTMTGIRRARYQHRDATDQILTAPLAVRPATLAFAWGKAPAIPGANALYLYIKGSKTDSLGQTAYPVATDEFLMNWTNFKYLAADRGWLTLTTGGKVMVVPEIYSDRLTGEIFQTSFIVRPKTNFPWPTTRLDGTPANQGKLDPNGAPPIARDDYKIVSANASAPISVLANDQSSDGQLIASGYTYARNGNVSPRSNGGYDYTPYPDFTGTDQFTYWVRNRQGFVSRATVYITVR